MECLTVIQDPALLEQLLPRLENVLAPQLRAKLSDWAYQELLAGMEDSQAGRTHSEEEVDAILAEALAKSRGQKQTLNWGDAKAA